MEGKEALLDFQAKLKSFKDAAYGLLRSWEILDRSSFNTLIDDVSKDYPFGESFDETVLKIMDWKVSVDKIRFPKGVFDWEPD